MFGLAARQLTRQFQGRSQQVFNRVPVRLMGGGDVSAQPKGKLEAIVRGYLPEDEQFVLGIFGLYASLFLLFKIIPSRKKEAPPAPVGESADNEVVSIVDDRFSDWYAQPGNAEKWEKSLNEIN